MLNPPLRYPSVDTSQRAFMGPVHPQEVTTPINGHVDLAGYPNVNAFLRRVEALPGFVPFAETPAGLTAAA